MEHFARFQKRKNKFFENQKKHLRHAVGKKTQGEKEQEEKERKEQNNSGSGSGSANSGEGNDSDKDKDKELIETDGKGKGKAKAKYEEKNDGIEDKALEEDEIWKSTSQWRREVLTGKVRKAEKIGEEKWKAAMEGGSSSKTDKPEKPNDQAATQSASAPVPSRGSSAI